MVLVQSTGVEAPRVHQEVQVQDPAQTGLVLDYVTNATASSST
jgi:hypothetical protein